MYTIIDASYTIQSYAPTHFCTMAPIVIYSIHTTVYWYTRRLNINYIYINSMQFVLISPSPNRKIYSTH